MNKQHLSLYKIDPNYLRYMHSLDYRISVKYNNRPFVGIVTMINGINYVIPLTSQTTEERKKDGKKKRSSATTTFVRDSNGTEIANLLHNNMFPVIEGVYSLLEIDAETDTYESNEIRFIRKHSDDIVQKAQKVYAKRIGGKDLFMQKICCDFTLLESKTGDYSIEPK